MKNPLPTTRKESLLSNRALAQRWECSVMHIWRLRRDGKLTAVSIGKRAVRYRLSDVEAIEAAGAV